MANIDGVIPTELELLRLKAAILELEADAKVQQARLRDQFAMAAVSAIDIERDANYDWEYVAVASYAIADAMLAERDK